jgi:peroxiredoxin Q/BCP
VQAYRDRHADVEKKGARIVGISTDDVATQKRFKDTYGLPYPLLSDPGGKVARQYGGVVPIVGVANRATFVVSQDGRIAEIVAGSDAIDPTASIAACPTKH